MGIGGSSSKSTSTGAASTSTAPNILTPYLTEIAKAAQGAYAKVPQTGFTGDLVAPANADQTGAVTGQKAVAGQLSSSGFGNSTLNAADLNAQRISNGYFTAPAHNTYTAAPIGTQADINSYLQPVLQNLQENVIPGVQSNAIKQGAYGGSRYNADLGKQINDNFTTSANNIASQIGYGEQVRQQGQDFAGWQTNQNLFPDLLKTEQAAALTTPDLANAGVQQLLTPSTILGQAGQTEQGWSQDQLDQAYQKYLLSTETPFAGLDQYAGLIDSLPTGSNTTTKQLGTAQQGSSSSAGSSILQGLGTAASIASIFGWSDARLKENVEPAGASNGHTLYEFNYLGSPRRFIGVMAQEVQAIDPAAVVLTPSGFYAVNYARIGVPFREVL